MDIKVLVILVVTNQLNHLPPFSFCRRVSRNRMGLMDVSVLWELEVFPLKIHDPKRYGYLSS